MDKKNTAIGVLLIIAAIGFMLYGQRHAPAQPQPEVISPAGSTPAASSTTENAAATTPAATDATAPVANASQAAFAAVAHDSKEATVTTLQNDFVTVHFTDFGGAVRDVALKKYAAEQGRPDPVVFNAVRADPMLAFVNLPGLDRNTGFQLVSATATEVVYRAVYDGRIEVTRRYTLPAAPDEKHDPYQLRHETTFRNLTAQSVPMPRFGWSVGTAQALNHTVYGQLVTTGFSTGKDQTFIPPANLAPSSGTFGFGAHAATPEIVSGGPIVWSAVDNQFFTSILTPDAPASAFVTRRIKIDPLLPDTNAQAFGLTGAAQFDLGSLPANGSSTLGANFYVGPKEYKRLSNGDIFKAGQDKIMQYGFFHFFSQLLITLMTWMHGLVSNWGVAIILTTLTLKTVFLPLTLKASRSMKRMAKLQPQMAALREKYKDNPQKQQSALMELYKEHKINPLGGCIPMLLPLPFFFGFYRMLYNAAELRFEPFLWAHDLSAPDTIAHIFGLPLNILPLLMGATMIYQTTLTPTPTVDNAQAKMMKFMPIVFTLFCYNFSCALSLYSFVNGLFTIIQQLIINRMKDDGDPAGTPARATVGSSGKPIKNVTPKKR